MDEDHIYGPAEVKCARDGCRRSMDTHPSSAHHNRVCKHIICTQCKYNHIDPDGWDKEDDEEVRKKYCPVKGCKVQSKSEDYDTVYHEGTKKQRTNKKRKDNARRQKDNWDKYMGVKCDLWRKQWSAKNLYWKKWKTEKLKFYDTTRRHLNRRSQEKEKKHAKQQRRKITTEAWKVNRTEVRMQKKFRYKSKSERKPNQFWRDREKMKRRERAKIERIWTEKQSDMKQQMRGPNNELAKQVNREAKAAHRRERRIEINRTDPTNQKELRALMGMLWHYRKVIVGFEELASSITWLLVENTLWTWTDECEYSLDQIKEAIREFQTHRGS